MELFDALSAGRLQRLSQALAALLIATAIGCGGPAGSGADSSDQETADAAVALTSSATVTFASHVAPVLWEHCLPCHRSGGIGPFPLDGYDAAARRIDQILGVVESGYMPPWKPVGGFRAARVLDDSERLALQRWRDGGLERGGEAPPRPSFPDGAWQLGEPDVVLELDPPFELPAAGADQVRNFVLPIPHLAGRHVAALELAPRSRGVIHHANVLADSTGTARELDARTEEPGYEGMVGAVAPGGHFFGWTPGKSARALEADAAWQIEQGTDLVLQLHVQPSGREEQVAPRIGLHFTDRPPRRRPVTVHLGSTAIDLAPREGLQTVADSFELPYDVEAVSVYPHAHDLARTVRVWAMTPEGDDLPLLRIDDWDFDWQDEYTYTKPLRLSAGSVLHLEIGYENSAANVRNPHAPPRRVLWGPDSSDEMADVWIKVFAADETQRPALRRAAARKDLEIALDGFRKRIELEPDVAAWPQRLALALLNLGRGREALPLLEAGLQRFPDDAGLRYDLGLAASAAGRPDAARRHFERALALRPGHGPTLNNLAALDLAAGDATAAQARLAPLVQTESTSDPRLRLDALLNLGLAELLLRDFTAASRHLGEARELAPGDERVHNHLGSLAAQRGERAAARRHFQRAAELAPERTEALKNLASLEAALGSPEAAIPHLARARAVDPEDRDATALLARAYGEAGRAQRAVQILETLVEQRPGDGAAHFDLALWLDALGRSGEALAHARRAHQLLPEDPDACAQLATLLAAAGQLAEALQTLDRFPRAALTPDLLLLDARIALAAGDRRRAERAVERLRREAPELLQSAEARQVVEALS